MYEFKSDDPHSSRHFSKVTNFTFIFLLNRSSKGSICIFRAILKGHFFIIRITLSAAFVQNK